ncbi:hypothetical protein UFOVP327_12 [uncultured Caudovirales phage]|uniref:Uncharacterized protein n=1 Tax=uncultured Caudovirales phage TaxID=2100421 RepID=A0A6J5LS26_9CAUD|nr:hypothetical protein UFOVP327_12 [uncultured Caudovirales phage]
MKLNQQQLDFVKTRLVSEFQDGQTSDRYWFDTDQVSLIWVSEEESWYALRPNQTWDYYTAGDVDDFVDTLSDQQLTAWILEDFGCDPEDLEEYIQDELEEAV